MQKSYKNICYRCGRERIVLRVWVEKLENSTIENKETACPDKECQEATEQDITRQRNKRLLLEKRKMESARNRKTKVHNISVQHRKN